MTELTKEQMEQAARFMVRSREAFALVGEFMWHFAMLEDDLNNLVEQMMGLETMNGAILINHLDIAKKVNLAVCGMQLQPIDQKAAIKDLNKIFGINEDRKIVAHCLFGPTTEGEAVDFHRTTTNKKLSLDLVTWTKDDFRAKFERMTEVRNRLVDLTNTVKMVQSELFSRWLESTSPFESQSGGGILSSLFAEEREAIPLEPDALKREGD
jgi:hypothetical protein